MYTEHDVEIVENALALVADSIGARPELLETFYAFSEEPHMHPFARVLPSISTFLPQNTISSMEFLLPLPHQLSDLHTRGF
jgi:hypothetical protein